MRPFLFVAFAGLCWAQNPVGYINPAAAVGLGPSGWLYLQTNSSGLLLTGPAGGQSGSGPSGFIAPYAMVGKAPDGSWRYMQTDTNGNLLTSGQTAGTVTSVGCGTVISWMQCSFGSPTTTPSLSLSATTGQTSHQVIGTCGSAAAFGPCALTDADLPANGTTRAINADFGDFSSGASALSTSQIACTLVRFAGTITAADITAYPSGSATVDVRTVAKASWTGPPSTSSITASAPMALSSNTLYTSPLTGWSYTGSAFPANTEFCFYLTSPSTVTGLQVSLSVTAN
jgi:hypothetical protein